jgi:tRNA-splicing ligase RtcB
MAPAECRERTARQRSARWASQIRRERSRIVKQVIHEEGSRPIHLWTEDIDDGALQQLKNVAKLPFIHKHGVAAMPDVHWGIGATVGSVIATKGAIIPAAVGVDIGCGMNAYARP